MKESKPTLIEVDLRRRETEAGWNRVIDTFALEATPKWFEWLGWVLVIAAFQYLADQSGSRAIYFLLALSFVLLWLYFNAFFFRLRFKGLPLVRSAPVEHAASILISGAFSASCFFAAKWAARVLAAHTKRWCIRRLPGCRSL